MGLDSSVLPHLKKGEATTPNANKSVFPPTYKKSAVSCGETAPEYSYANVSELFSPHVSPTQLIAPPPALKAARNGVGERVHANT